MSDVLDISIPLWLEDGLELHLDLGRRLQLQLSFDNRLGLGFDRRFGLNSWLGCSLDDGLAGKGRPGTFGWPSYRRGNGCRYFGGLSNNCNSGCLGNGRTLRGSSSSDVVIVSIKLGEFRRGTIESLLCTATFMLGDGKFPIGINVEER